MEDENIVAVPDADNWDDIDLSDVVDSEAQETEAAAEGAEAEAETEPTETESSDQSFKLKYMGEEKDFSREETITLAQKGMDYDRVRAKLDEYTKGEERKESEATQFVSEIAKAQNMTVEQFMENYRASTLATNENITVDEALSRIRIERREKELAERENALKEQEAAKTSEESLKEKRSKDFLDFFKARPDVKADSIPKEVFQKYSEGTPLLTAYALYENEKLKAELEAEKQNKKNASRSVGSAKTTGKSKTAAFDDLWNDGT